MKQALILVDLQNDFFPGGALAVPQGDAILPVLKKIFETMPFDKVIATKDWHPKDHGSFASNHGKKTGEVVLLEGIRQILWPIHCVENTQGAEFAPGFDTQRIHKTFYKGTDPFIDSYSAFFDNGHKKSTGLGEYLAEEGIRKITIMGLATDYCVRYSVIDALSLGLDVTVIANGCRAVDLRPGDGKRALSEMKEAGAKILTI